MNIQPRRQEGFTLVEILIVLAISGIVASAVLSMFKSQSDSYLAENQKVEAMQNVRAAMEMISRDVRNAGLFIGSFNPSLPEGVFHLGDMTTPDGKGAKFQDDQYRNSDAILMRTFDLEQGVKIQDINGNSKKLYVCSEDTLKPSDLIVAMDTTRGNFEPRVLTREKENKNCDGCPKKGCDSLDYKKKGSQNNEYLNDWISKYNTGGLGVEYSGGIVIPMKTVQYYVEPEYIKANGEVVPPALMRCEPSDPQGCKKDDPTFVVAYNIESVEFVYKDGAGNEITIQSDVGKIRSVEIFVNGSTRNLLPTSQGDFPYARELRSEIKVQNLGL